MKAKIGVKFCGNCNPQIDGPELVKELQRLNTDLLFTSYKDEGIDVLLIVSACPVDCASRPYFQGPTVIVGGYTLDFTPIEPSQFPAALSQELRKRLGHRGKNDNF